LADTIDIEAMHAVRLAVRENVLSDPSRVERRHYVELLQERGRGWVHEEDARVVAFGIADHAGRSIWALFVLPAFEGRGIGRHILQLMVTWLFEQGNESIWLTTERHTRAEQFYRAAGWREAGQADFGNLRLELARG
jgi:GNAT superfamily N-acetyltransferase